MKLTQRQLRHLIETAVDEVQKGASLRRGKRKKPIPVRQHQPSGEVDTRAAIALVIKLKEARDAIVACLAVFEQGQILFDEMTNDQVDCLGEIKEEYQRFGDLIKQAQKAFIGGEDEHLDRALDDE